GQLVDQFANRDGPRRADNPAHQAPADDEHPVAQQVAESFGFQSLDQIGEAGRIEIASGGGKHFDQFFVCRCAGDSVSKRGNVFEGDGFPGQATEFNALTDNLLAAQPEADQLAIDDLESVEKALKGILV